LTEHRKLPGRAAAGAFRLRQLLAAAQAADPTVTALRGRHWHFVELQRALSPQREKILRQLLDDGEGGGRGHGEGGGEGAAETFLITPRLGTLSPWSSKATDIVHVCGLHEVLRVERGTLWQVLRAAAPASQPRRAAVAQVLHDPMTESQLPSLDDYRQLFHHAPAAPLRTVNVDGLAAAAAQLGLALSGEELDYLASHYRGLKRAATDAELVMFGQVNSEHCRHKIFNAEWRGDGDGGGSLMDMVRATHAANPAGTVTAYADNAAVLAGRGLSMFTADPATNTWRRAAKTTVHTTAKVETHNHPTAISPRPGAATGSGGEIRDAAATGRGARPKAGLAGFSVSHLRIPGHRRPWEGAARSPARIASPLSIMLGAPLGAAAFNNEFGRPCIGGYFRTLEWWGRGGDSSPGGTAIRGRGYHKPIMLAGGIGAIAEAQVQKCAIPAGSAIIVLGGPAMLIGLGGGSASSGRAGAGDEQLDFASVQRGNPEMQRRCQEVITRCADAGDANPILAIHDVGAGGLSNAVPELLHGGGAGGVIQLRDIKSGDPSLSPMELWCNEAQERYVLAVAASHVPRFAAVCARERCPFCVIGAATGDGRLLVEDRDAPPPAPPPVDLPLDFLLGKLPRMVRSYVSRPAPLPPALSSTVIHDDIAGMLNRVLRLPAVADKTFLVTIGDRSVGGLVCRDPMVGRFQVPVADVAVTAAGFDGWHGEAVAVGERPALALTDAQASGRMAAAEALTNIAAAGCGTVDTVKLSANWMAACGDAGEDAALRDTVRAVTKMCREIGVAIPVGKDSLSMRTRWRDGGAEVEVSAPLSLVATAFAAVDDVRATLTPALGGGALFLVDLGGGRNRLGGSALMQVYEKAGNGGAVPDCDDAQLLREFFNTLRACAGDGLLAAYHDRSDGGAVAALLEMAFASGCGLEIQVPETVDAAEFLFNEELGAVVQVAEPHVEEVNRRFMRAGLAPVKIAHRKNTPQIKIVQGKKILLDQALGDLRRAWSETSWLMQKLRDNPQCADEAYAKAAGTGGGLFAELAPGFTPDTFAAPPAPGLALAKPKVAVLREVGVNGQVEMAAAFDRAGFCAVDVAMSDLRGGGDLRGFHGLAVCGGFSYGDVLGGGLGWAKSILFNPAARGCFAEFFRRGETFTLGVCNGCQMLAALKEIIPGAQHWPRFTANRSGRFESRLLMVEIMPGPSLFFRGMAGSKLPIPAAHGEGRASFSSPAQQRALAAALRYATRAGAAETHPENPSGTRGGICGATTADGRATILMPHPERALRAANLSWHPPQWTGASPWQRMFTNAREWVG